MKLRKWFVKDKRINYEYNPNCGENAGPFDYGLDFLNIALSSGNYGWTDPIVLPKRLVLVDLEAYREKVSIFSLISAWRGTGNYQWEALLAGIFVAALLRAYEKGAKEVDITKMFDRDLLANKNQVFTRSQIHDHIIKTFTKVDEDDYYIYLRLNVA